MGRRLHAETPERRADRLPPALSTDMRRPCIEERTSKRLQAQRARRTPSRPPTPVSTSGSNSAPMTPGTRPTWTETRTATPLMVFPSPMDSGPQVGKSKAEYMREWRRRNPDRVRDYNERRRIPPTESRCVECNTSIVGQKGKLLCSRRCKDNRYQRTHPEEYRENAAAKMRGALDHARRHGEWG